MIKHQWCSNISRFTENDLSLSLPTNMRDLYPRFMWWTVWTVRNRNNPEKKKKEKLSEQLRPFTYSLLSESGPQRGKMCHKTQPSDFLLTGTVLKGPTAYHDKVWDVLRSTACCSSTFFLLLRQSRYIWAINSVTRQTQADSCPSVLRSSASTVSFLVSYLPSFFGVLFNPPLSHLVTHFRQSVLVQIHTTS